MGRPVAVELVDMKINLPRATIKKRKAASLTSFHAQAVSPYRALSFGSERVTIINDALFPFTHERLDVKIDWTTLYIVLLCVLAMSMFLSTLVDLGMTH